MGDLTNFTIKPTTISIEGFATNIEKSHVKNYVKKTKSGKMVNVKEHDDKRTKKPMGDVKIDEKIRRAKLMVKTFERHIKSLDELAVHFPHRKKEFDEDRELANGLLKNYQAQIKAYGDLKKIKAKENENKKD